MKVVIIPIVIGAFGTVTKGLWKGLEDLEVDGRVETIQTTALLKTARILRRVPETWGDLLSLQLQWKTISQSWCDKLSRSKIIIIIIIIIIIKCIIAMMPLNQILRKCTARHKVSWSQEKINHLMYMDNIKLFAKMKKKWKTEYTQLKYTVKT